MAEVIRTWLRSRLGVIIDLTPEVFGHYCRDGTFLAKLLHSYDIINDSQLNTITSTSDPALARVNLRHLRVWLRFIGITCDDKIIYQISDGKGTAAIRLFYKVFLCLENKDRLHFITLEKEREKYIPASTKFDVKVVAEDTSLELPKHPLSTLLKDNADNIEWYKKHFQRIGEEFKRERENFRQSQQSKESLHLPKEKIDSAYSTKATNRKKLTELDEFAKKHEVDSTECERLKNSDLSMKNAGGSHDQKDLEAAKEFINILRKRKQHAIETQNFKSQMHKMLLSQVWEKIENDQETEFDKIIASKILYQSQYEKQMISKLCDIRNEKRRLAANRQLVDELIQKTKDNHINTIRESTREMKFWENEEIDDEYRRQNELHQRIKKEKLKYIQRQYYEMNSDIVNDIIDISIKAGEIKRTNDNIIPERLWNEWKILFLNNLPIFELDNSIHSENPNKDIEEIMVDNQLKRKDVLSEKDFEDYHNLKPPWDKFVPEFDDDAKEFLSVGVIVLGYTVHRLIDLMASHPLMPVKAKLPNVKVRAVLLGIPDRSFYSPLQNLLKRKKIKLVLAEDAINYCLQRYKEEVKDHQYVDVNFKLNSKSENPSTESVIHEKLNNSDSINKDDKEQSLKNMTFAVDEELIDKSIGDKQTQTPKTIPYDDMDPELSDPAYIGKWIYEFFTLGESISEELLANAMLEYLKSLKDIQGWVLVNYPNTYQQMVSLECSLFDNKIPEVPEQNNHLNIDDITINGSETTRPRITFELGNKSFQCFKESKLLPNPLGNKEPSVPVSSFNTFIRMHPKPTNVDINPEFLFELRPEDATDLDKFYSDHGLASAVYYTVCDSSTIKRVARLIIGETSLPRKSSIELFGQASKISDNARDKSVSNSKEGLKSITEELKLEIQKPKPGEPEWSWVNLTLSLEISYILASLWKNLENVYIDGLKNIFIEKRSNSTAIFPYKEFVVQKMIKFLEKPNEKEELFEDFRNAFNEIPEDVRDDDDVKYELYCRVAEFQTKLWDICDVERRKADEERKKIIFDHWTAVQAIDLINIYLTLIQLEMDRFMDTLRLIQSYYLSMLQRPFEDEKFSKILLCKVTSDSKNSDLIEQTTSLQNSLRNENENSKSDMPNHQYNAPVVNVKENDLKMEVAEILSTKESTDLINSSGYKIINSNIAFVNSVINSTMMFIKDSLKKEEKILLPRRSSERKGKRKSSKKISISSDSKEDLNSVAKKYQDLLSEWEYAAMYEIIRVQMRIKLLEASAKSDLSYLLENIRRVFTFVHEMINEKYENEMKNVDNALKIFCLAIEKDKSVAEKIKLDDDVSIISILSGDTSISSFPNDIIDNFAFSPEQLGRLKDIFHHIAPSGFIAERSFIYILQDLIICSDKDKISFLASSWYNLKPDDIMEMVYELFGNEEYIDWREFLIYLMDIPMPNQDELLDAKEAFREKDPNSTEVIFRRDFMMTPLWFVKCPLPPSIRSLSDDFDKDEEALFDNELDFQGNKNSTELSVKLKKPGKNSLFSIKSNEKVNSEDEKQRAEIEKHSLFKQLLCEIYLINYYTVNYMAMLLPFCKDKNPSYGLGKAIGLSLGQKICLNFIEGENYVNKLLEKKRLSNDMKAILRRETLEFCKELTEAMIDKVMETCELKLVEIHDESIFNIISVTKDKRHILIENLDVPGEAVNPTSLLIEETQSSNSYDINKVDEDSNNSSEMSNLSSDTIINVENEFINEREIIYWIPTQVFESVLLSLVPLNEIQSYEFRTPVLLSEYFQSIYKEIQCEELEEKSDVVLIHRLLHHELIIQMLKLTDIFTSKKIANIVKNLLRN